MPLTSVARSGRLGIPQVIAHSRFDHHHFFAQPSERDTFPTHRLMTEHPPVLLDPNKRVVFEAARPAGTLREGGGDRLVPLADDAAAGARRTWPRGPPH